MSAIAMKPFANIEEAVAWIESIPTSGDLCLLIDDIGKCSTVKYGVNKPQLFELEPRDYFGSIIFGLIVIVALGYLWLWISSL